jgi:hypothetical protein
MWLFSSFLPSENRFPKEQTPSGSPSNIRLTNVEVEYQGRDLGAGTKTPAVKIKFIDFDISKLSRASK